jgi:aminoglycoside 6'-N-acetyltransferase I
MFRIIDAQTASDSIIQQMAQLLVDAFRDNWPEAWPTLEDAEEELEDALDPERICLVALDEDSAAVGWIGGIAEYDGNVWELHPLAVRPDLQGRGVGRALVLDFEAEVAKRGGLTIRVGTDDEANMTTLSNVDLYDDLPSKIAAVRNLRHHPYEFYQKLGYVIIGVMPDANGIGKPDIIMGKRVTSS